MQLKISKNVNFFTSLLTSLNYLIWGCIKNHFLLFLKGVRRMENPSKGNKLNKKLKDKKIDTILIEDLVGQKSSELIKFNSKDYFQKNQSDKFDKYTDTLLYQQQEMTH